MTPHPSQPTAYDLQTNPLFRAIVGGLSLATGISAIVLAGMSITSTPRVWYMLGFEVVIAFASVFGVLIAMGRFREGPALALACVTGAIGVGSLLAYVGPAKSVLEGGAKFYLLARGADAAALGLAACMLVLMRAPRPAFRSIIIGLVWGAVMVGVAVVALRVHASLAGAPGAMRFGASVVFGAMFVASLSAAVHYVVRAFQCGVHLPARA